MPGNWSSSLKNLGRGIIFKTRKKDNDDDGGDDDDHDDDDDDKSDDGDLVLRSLEK